MNTFLVVTYVFDAVFLAVTAYFLWMGHICNKARDWYLGPSPRNGEAKPSYVLTFERRWGKS